MCDKPKTVSGLRSWRGSVKFNEICLQGNQLAKVSEPIDKEVPSSRSGKELITWTPELTKSFLLVQEILKSPLMVTVPKKGDKIILASDGCTSLPAGGVKMLVERPGVPGYLPSFKWG